MRIETAAASASAFAVLSEMNQYLDLGKVLGTEVGKLIGARVCFARDSRPRKIECMQCTFLQ